MSIATITIEDIPPIDPTQGATQMRVEVNYGKGGFDEGSDAHALINTLSQAVHAYFERTGAVNDRSEEPAVPEQEAAHGV